MAAKLDRADIICGYPAKKICVFLGYDRSGAFDRGDVLKPDVFWKIAGEHFGSKAKAVVAELFKRGWLLKARASDDDIGYAEKGAPIIGLTQTGKQSRIVSLQKRFSRAEGEVVVAKLIERAQEINARGDLLYGVSELRLYGSMIDPKAETVGDVDVAYELYRRTPLAGMKWSEWNSQRATASGRNLDYRAKLSYGIKEVRLLLTDRNPRLSLQGMDHFLRLKPALKSRMIFKTDRKLTPRERSTERCEA
jgi:predicted nucleotidyltransferase